jgi:ribonuclease P protein component
MSLTYNPKKGKRAKAHGFLVSTKYLTNSPNRAIMLSLLHMLPRRLKIPKDLIPNVLKKGHTSSSPSFLTKILQYPEAKNSLFLVIVSKKVSKKAVERNLIKRRIYEAVQSYLKNIKPGFLVLFTPQNSSIKTNLAGFKKEIKEALVRNDILN